MKKLAIIAAVAVALTQTIQATPITGSIDMSGTAFLNDVNLGSATAVTSITAATVGGIPTGSYTGTGGTAVTWTGFSWPGGSANPLWTFTSGLWAYSFQLLSDSVVSQDNSFLNLLGTGTLNITGVGSPYEATSGTWSFTISNPSGGAHPNFAFTFANSQTAVPDGGSTMLLLGSALTGLGFLKRKLVG